MYDRFEEATEPAADLDAAHEGEIETLDLLDSRVQTATLPIGAQEAYELFCDVHSTRSWVSVVSSVRILERTASGRPGKVAFLARLDGASIGYTLHYRYQDDDLKVSWATPPHASTRVVGQAYFLPLGDEASLMHYELSLDLPSDSLPSWDDPFFHSNAASAVVNDFRDYITRRVK